MAEESPETAKEQAPAKNENDKKNIESDDTSTSGDEKNEDEKKEQVTKDEDHNTSKDYHHKSHHHHDQEEKVHHCEHCAAMCKSKAESCKIIESPNPDDILMGRGRPYQRHPGNGKMRVLVEQNRTRYGSVHRDQRGAIANELLDEILSTGARFLKRREEEFHHDGIHGTKKSKTLKGWITATRSEAYEKICHALRAKYRPSDDKGEAAGKGGSFTSTSKTAIRHHRQQKRLSTGSADSKSSTDRRHSKSWLSEQQASMSAASMKMAGGGGALPAGMMGGRQGMMMQLHPDQQLSSSAMMMNGGNMGMGGMGMTPSSPMMMSGGNMGMGGMGVMPSSAMMMNGNMMGMPNAMMMNGNMMGMPNAAMMMNGNAMGMTNPSQMMMMNGTMGGMGMMPSSAVDMMPQSGLLYPQGMGASALSATMQHEENIRRLSRVDPTAAAMYSSRVPASSAATKPSSLAARAAAGIPGASDQLAMQGILERERLLGRAGM